MDSSKPPSQEDDHLNLVLGRLPCQIQPVDLPQFLVSQLNSYCHGRAHAPILRPR
jgi:hypothetical protein